MVRGSATIEYQANRCSNHPDKTKFDAIFSIEKKCVWGIEAKYFDNLWSEQIKREAKAIENVSKYLGYEKAGVLFLLPEQQLGTIVSSNSDKVIRACISDLITKGQISIRFTSWEIIFEIIKRCGNDKIKREIDQYCKFRNNNKRGYTTDFSKKAKIKNWYDWNDLILNPKNAPRDLPKLKANRKLRDYGKSSAKLEDIFHGDQIDLALSIIDKSNLVPQYRKTGYANLYKNDKANAQLHPCTNGIDIVIRDADKKCPKSVFLKTKEISYLNGYKGTNKGWLEGDGKRGTSKPAVAFTLPIDLMQKPKHQGWEEIDDLLLYAYKK
jgi:hypothetical protein